MRKREMVFQVSYIGATRKRGPGIRITCIKGLPPSEDWSRTITYRYCYDNALRQALACLQVAGFRVLHYDGKAVQGKYFVQIERDLDKAKQFFIYRRKYD